jgi:hypothetical protein
MTNQIIDKVSFRNEKYTLFVTNTGRPLFAPQYYGIEPVGYSTATQNGFYSEYLVRDDELYLTKAFIGLDIRHEDLAKGNGPELFGVRPKRWKYNRDGSIRTESLIFGKFSIPYISWESDAL